MDMRNQNVYLGICKIFFGVLTFLILYIDDDIFIKKISDSFFLEFFSSFFVIICFSLQINLNLLSEAQSYSHKDSFKI